jgi:predicted SAM-dependent methyltransferase
MQATLKHSAINAGCNDIHLDGHVNIDIDKNNNPEIVYDVTKLEEIIEPGTIQHIYAGHLLEHLTKEQGMEFLQTCKKLLVSHGVLTVVVPDWRKCALCKSHQEAENTILAYGQHLRLYDEETLESELKSVFSEVHVVDHKNVKYTIHKDDPLATAAIAINHPECEWKYVFRKSEHPSTVEWKKTQPHKEG